jgi:hypothetical protein
VAGQEKERSKGWETAAVLRLHGANIVITLSVSCGRVTENHLGHEDDGSAPLASGSTSIDDARFNAVPRYILMVCVDLKSNGTAGSYQANYAMGSGHFQPACCFGPDQSWPAAKL